MPPQADASPDRQRAKDPVTLVFIFLNPVTIGIVLATVLLPRGLLLRLLAAFAVAWLFWPVFAPPSRIADGGPGEAVGFAIAMLIGMFAAAALALRAALELWRWWRDPQYWSGPCRSRVLDPLIFAAASVALACRAIIALGRALQGTSHGPLLHVLATLAALAALVAAGWARPHFLRLPIRVFAATFAALSLWGLSVFPGLVRDSATELAGGAPYCIALNERNRPLEAPGDLTFFAMDKARYGRHAVLLADTTDGPVAWHWSYHARAFLKDTRGPDDPGNVACIPRPDYLGTLGQGDRPFEAIVNGERIVVPTAYDPRLSGPLLSLAAAPPDFAPDPALAPFSARTFALRSSVQSGGADWLRKGFRDHLTEGRDAPPAHGLTTRYGDKGGITYLSVDPGGGIAAWIGCPFPAVPDGRCQHHFARGDDLYTIWQPAALLPDWRVIEDRMVALVIGFRQPE